MATDPASAETLQQLKHRIAQLEQQLSEMARQHEALMYTISHDLRTPLMTVLGFTDMLIGDFSAAGNQSSALQYLQHIRQAATKQSKLFEEVLKLSRLMRCEVRKEDVNLMALAAVGTARLRAAEPERSVRVDMGPATIAQVDPELFGLVMDALLANAWKFTRKVAQPHIEITTERRDDELICTIRDNGVGFDPNMKERLFQPFKRLHSDKEYPGLGMGLATAATLVRAHGGRIWAESRPGEGSLFSFSLPA